VLFTNVIPLHVLKAAVDCLLFLTSPV